MAPQGIIQALGGVIWESLWHGTALALVTGLLSVSLLRRCGPALKATLWTLVLIKFLLPPQLIPGAFSFSHWLGIWTEPISPPGAGPELPAVLLHTVLPGQTIPATAASSWWIWLLATGYVAGVGACAVRWVLTSRRVRRQLRSLPPASPWLQCEVDSLVRAVGLGRSPAILASRAPQSPYMVGLFRATLVVPEPMLARLPVESRRALLLHELAHLRRADLLVRWLQNLVKTLFFFWPPVWWVCRRIDCFSEMACDQWAVLSSRISKRQYAETVLEVARSLAGASQRQVNLALVGRGRFLEERFEMILNATTTTSKGWLGAMSLVLWAPFALAGAAAGPQEQPAQEQQHRFVRVQAQDEAGDPLPAELLEAIPEADLNGDGILTVAELKEHLHATNPEGPHRIVVRKVAKRSPEGGEEPVEVEVFVSSEDKSEPLVWHERSEGEMAEGKVRTLRIRPGPDADYPLVVSVDSGHSLESILEMHPDADTNGDGVLEREELLGWMKQQPLDQPLRFRFRNERKIEVDVLIVRPEEGQTGWATLEGGNVFVHRADRSEVDTDGDGQVSKQELEAYRQTCCPEAEGEDAAIFITMTLEEPLQIVTSPADSAERLSRLLKKYPEADLDGDGALSKEEALALAVRLQKASREKQPQ